MEGPLTQLANRPIQAAGVVALVAVALYLANAIYNIYFHPLRHIPGPKLYAASRFPWIRHVIAGTTVFQSHELHKKYGEVVRLSPNEVSFITADTAWQDIYGFRTGRLKGHPNMPKDPAWYSAMSVTRDAATEGAQSIHSAGDEEHARGRKALSHAFSERALTAQEGLIQNYVNQLISRLTEISAASKATIDMTQWYAWTTFDVTSDLLFGEPFGCLSNLEMHRYIKLLMKDIEVVRIYYVLWYFPWMRYLRKYLGITSLEVVQNSGEYDEWVKTQTEKRCARDTDRPDFITYIQAYNKKENDGALNQAQINGNAGLILSAGSETTATLLSAVTYALLSNPSVYQKLKEEVRGRWSSLDDITMLEVNNSEYLLAVLKEGLRWFPPTPVGFSRYTAHAGEIVSGYYIPQNTSLSVSQYAAYRSESNFKDAESFIPERWLGDERYRDDKKDALQPFSYGPRNCLGKNLAYAEMRLILAKCVWAFDMELDKAAAGWVERCRSPRLWRKPELPIWVKAVHKQ